MATTYYFLKEVETTSIDIQESIDTVFHEDMYQFCMEQDIQANGAESVYFS